MVYKDTPRTGTANCKPPSRSLRPLRDSVEQPLRVSPPKTDTAQALLVLRRDFYRAMGQARARVGGWVEEVSSWDVLESIEMTAQVQRCPTLVGCLEEAGHHRTSPNID